jgi:hypothetical protein
MTSLLAEFRSWKFAVRGMGVNHVTTTFASANVLDKSCISGSSLWTWALVRWLMEALNGLTVEKLQKKKRIHAYENSWTEEA